MFTNITQDYTFQDASLEILIMLAFALVLGYLFGRLRMRQCKCTRRNTEQKPVQKAATTKVVAKKKTTETAPVEAPVAQPLIDTTDLKIIEGIGPKIEELLKAEGITEWRILARTGKRKLKKILTEGGERFQLHDPSTWADQAALARDGRWKELKEYQTLLIGGRKTR